ncbi:MAG: hypothetical protein DMG85_21190 [Acidobacteria bacterium]|nr:MAG: hypothetical protein DMG85_21190 [Acidobacteriota bacterium]
MIFYGICEAKFSNNLRRIRKIRAELGRPDLVILDQRSLLGETSFRKRLTSADSGVPVGSGDRAKRGLSEDPAPRASSARPKTKLKLRMT